MKAHKHPRHTIPIGNCQADRMAKLGTMQPELLPDFGAYNVLEFTDGGYWPHSPRHLARTLRRSFFRFRNNTVLPVQKAERRYQRALRRTTPLQLLISQKSAFLHDSCMCGWDPGVWNTLHDLREIHPLECRKADWGQDADGKKLDAATIWWNHFGRRLPGLFWELDGEAWPGVQDQTFWREVTHVEKPTPPRKKPILTTVYKHLPHSPHCTSSTRRSQASPNLPRTRSGGFSPLRTCTQSTPPRSATGSSPLAAAS